MLKQPTCSGSEVRTESAEGCCSVDHGSEMYTTLLAQSAGCSQNIHKRTFSSEKCWLQPKLMWTVLVAAKIYMEKVLVAAHTCNMNCIIIIYFIYIY